MAEEGYRKKIETVGDQCRRLRAAAARMGPLNPNQDLMMNAAYGLEQLVERLDRVNKRNEELELANRRIQ